MSDLLNDTQRAFDSVAREYDGASGNNALIQRMRSRLMFAVQQNIPRGQRLLDLGCGTGLDAEYLARAGYKLTALDWSAQMVQRAQTRMVSAGLQDRVETKHLGFHQLDKFADDSFDGAYSDLGALNCIENMDDFAAALFKIIKSDGKVIVSVIGRVCPWEWLLFVSKGQWQRANLRAARKMIPVPLNGNTVWTRYFTPNEFSRSFTKAGFRLVGVRALALFVPPSYLIGFAERHPRWIDFLQRMDDSLGDNLLFRSCGDHFLMMLKK